MRVCDTVSAISPKKSPVKKLAGLVYLSCRFSSLMRSAMRVCDTVSAISPKKSPVKKLAGLVYLSCRFSSLMRSAMRVCDTVSAISPKKSPDRSSCRGKRKEREKPVKSLSICDPSHSTYKKKKKNSIQASFRLY
jgi:hypothetical protein